MNWDNLELDIINKMKEGVASGKLTPDELNQYIEDRYTYYIKTTAKDTYGNSVTEIGTGLKMTLSVGTSVASSPKVPKPDLSKLFPAAPEIPREPSIPGLPKISKPDISLSSLIPDNPLANIQISGSLPKKKIPGLPEPTVPDVPLPSIPIPNLAEILKAMGIDINLLGFIPDLKFLLSLGISLPNPTVPGLPTASLDSASLQEPKIPDIPDIPLFPIKIKPEDLGSPAILATSGPAGAAIMWSNSVMGTTSPPPGMAVIITNKITNFMTVTPVILDNPDNIKSIDAPNAYPSRLIDALKIHYNSMTGVITGLLPNGSPAPPAPTFLV